MYPGGSGCLATMRPARFISIQRWPCTKVEVPDFVGKKPMA